MNNYRHNLLLRISLHENIKTEVYGQFKTISRMCQHYNINRFRNTITSTNNVIANLSLSRSIYSLSLHCTYRWNRLFLFIIQLTLSSLLQHTRTHTHTSNIKRVQLVKGKLLTSDILYKVNKILHIKAQKKLRLRICSFFEKLHYENLILFIRVR